MIKLIKMMHLLL